MSFHTCFLLVDFLGKLWKANDFVENELLIIISWRNAFGLSIYGMKIVIGHIFCEMMCFVN